MDAQRYHLEIRPLAGLPTYHLYRRDAGPRPVVVYGHGFRGNVRRHIERLYLIAEAGFYAFALEAEHHGLRTRADSLRLLDGEQNPHAADLFFRVLLQLSEEVSGCLAALGREDGSSADVRRLGALGISMGGYLALHLASRLPAMRAVCPLIATPEWQFQDAWSGCGLHPETQASIERESPHRRPEAFAGKAVQMQNSTRDDVSPIQGVRSFYRALQAVPGCHVELHTVYLEGHAISERMLHRAVRFLREHLLEEPRSGARPPAGPAGA